MVFQYFKKFTTDGKYKSIVAKIKKIDTEFKNFQGNKISNLKKKEKLDLLLNTLQNPNIDVDIDKTLEDVHVFMKSLKYTNAENLEKLEDNIKDLCIEIGNFLVESKIEKKHEELIKLKTEELNLIKSVMKYIDYEAEKAHDVNPLSQKNFDENVKSIDNLLAQIQQQENDAVYENVADIIENVNQKNITQNENIEQRMKNIRQNLENIDKLQSKFGPRKFKKKTTTLKDINEVFRKKLENIDQQVEEKEQAKEKMNKSKKQIMTNIKKIDKEKLRQIALRNLRLKEDELSTILKDEKKINEIMSRPLSKFEKKIRTDIINDGQVKAKSSKTTKKK